VAGFLKTWATDAALVRVSPPDRFGYCSLGPSVSYALAALEVASVRIAEVDETVPRTWGQSMVHESIFDVLVDSTRLMPEYPSVGATGVSRQIARHISGIVPPRPVLQLGIGSIPESLVELLADSDLSPLRFLGMATDAMVDIFERGRLDKSVVPRPAILTPELMGTRRLMDFSHDNPAVGLYPSSVSHSAGLLGEMERLVSINSAIEIDLSGDVNSEALHGRPIAGIGGSMDYVEAATRSKDGVRIIALPSTSSDGTSRIVDRLGPESPVTIPRSYVDYVVTEYGVARLAGLSLRERAEALLAIAHPAHVADLADAYERHPSGLRATADAPLAAKRVAVGAGRAVDEIVLPAESSEAQSASG
jgi:acyl-CoA hydrolase